MKGEWKDDPQKKMAAEQKVQAWKDKHGIKTPKMKKLPKEIAAKIRGKGNTALERLQDVMDTPKGSAVARFGAAVAGATLGVARAPEEKNE